MLILTSPGARCDALVASVSDSISSTAKNASSHLENVCRFWDKLLSLGSINGLVCVLAPYFGKQSEPVIQERNFICLGCNSPARKKAELQKGCNFPARKSRQLSVGVYFGAPQRGASWHAAAVPAADCSPSCLATPRHRRGCCSSRCVVPSPSSLSLEGDSGSAFRDFYSGLI